MVLGSKSKLVEPDAKPESPKSEDSGNIKCTDLIVFGIPYQLSETKLKEYFQQFGKLHMVQVPNNNFTLPFLKRYISIVFVLCR